MLRLHGVGAKVQWHRNKRVRTPAALLRLLSDEYIQERYERFYPLTMDWVITLLSFDKNGFGIK